MDDSMRMNIVPTSHLDYNNNYLLEYSASQWHGWRNVNGNLKTSRRYKLVSNHAPLIISVTRLLKARN